MPKKNSQNINNIIVPQNAGYFDFLNNNKYFAGIMMLLLNLGSKYLAAELSNSQEEFLNNVVIRRFIIFTVVFVATRDIWVSIIITGAFIILVSGLFHEESKYCIVPKNSKMFTDLTKYDYERARSVIKLYQLQQQKK